MGMAQWRDPGVDAGVGWIEQTACGRDSRQSIDEGHGQWDVAEMHQVPE